MQDDLRQELSGWGEVVKGNRSYKKIRYTIIIEKEDPNDDEPDIYGTVNDEKGDKLDIPQFVGSEEDIILNLEDGRCIKIVFLDESNEFEVDGSIENR
jgi:hypothetical protein